MAKSSKKSSMMGHTILDVVHEMAEDLYEVDGIDTVTMREYEALCLPPIRELSAKQIKHLREREKVSQPVFANFLNISPSTVKQWEQGTKRPRGGMLRLLNLVADQGLKIFMLPKRV